MNNKTCTCCGLTKSVDEFYKDVTKFGDLYYECKDCNRIRREKIKCLSKRNCEKVLLESEKYSEILGGKMPRLKEIKGIDLQVFAHLKFLDLRRLDRLLQSERFAEVWDKANVNKRRLILKSVKKMKPKELRELLKEERTVAELRTLARYFRIKNYSRKSYQQLLKEVEENERREKQYRKPIK